MTHGTVTTSCPFLAARRSAPSQSTPGVGASAVPSAAPAPGRAAPERQHAQHPGDSLGGERAFRHAAAGAKRSVPGGEGGHESRLDFGRRTVAVAVAGG